MWSDGIVEWCFTEEEILKQFQDNNIEIPDSLYLDFKNTIEKKKRIRNQKEIERINSHNH